MNKEELKALKESIEKWRCIYEEDGFDDGCDNCPLCQLADLTDEDSTICETCIIYKKTKTKECKNTPFEKWDKYWDSCDVDVGTGRFVETKKEKQMALKELNFLKSLLPKKESK